MPDLSGVLLRLHLLVSGGSPLCLQALLSLSLGQVRLIIEATLLPDLLLILLLVFLLMLIVNHDTILVVHNGVETLGGPNSL